MWFYQLQRTVDSLGGEDTFESTLFRLSTKRGLVLILVYVDDLLIAAQDQDEGEAFLQKLQAIWKNEGESALYFGVNRQYMTAFRELGRVC